VESREWLLLRIPQKSRIQLHHHHLAPACVGSMVSTCFSQEHCGFGPYVAAFLAEQNWTQQSIGFVLTAGGFAGLLSQLPGGALLDAIRSKRTAVGFGAGMVAAGALIIPAFKEID
jgi:predicted MFS family arabinose efflux permease